MSQMISIWLTGGMLWRERQTTSWMTIEKSDETRCLSKSLKSLKTKCPHRQEKIVTRLVTQEVWDNVKWKTGNEVAWVQVEIYKQTCDAKSWKQWRERLVIKLYERLKTTEDLSVAWATEDSCRQICGASGWGYLFNRLWRHLVSKLWGHYVSRM